MNEPQLNQKIHQDITMVNKDLNTWVNSSVAQLSSELEKVKDDATETVAHVTTTVKKNVGDGLIQYNAKATDVARKLPGGVGIMAGNYPWVAISIALLVGFLFRGFFMPRR